MGSDLDVRRFRPNILLALDDSEDESHWTEAHLAVGDVVLNVAMPTIGRSLRASGAELQLVVAGYTVSYAMMLITGARMGDLYGRRRMFLIGVFVFTAASLICGIAPGIEILIAARFVQGAGAAAMMPQIMSVIQVRFSGAARARALSAYTAVLSSRAHTVAVRATPCSNPISPT